MDRKCHILNHLCSAFFILYFCLSRTQGIRTLFLPQNIASTQKLAIFRQENYRFDITSTRTPKPLALLNDGSLILYRGKTTKKTPPPDEYITLSVKFKKCLHHEKITIVVLPPEIMLREPQIFDNFLSKCDTSESRQKRSTLPDLTIALRDEIDVGNTVFDFGSVYQPLRYYNFILEEGSGSNFYLDPVTGVLSLDSSMYNDDLVQDLYVTIQNILYPELETEFHLRVLVTISSIPLWTMPIYPYVAVVPVDAPNKACIYQLSASAGDGSTVNYFIRTTSDNAAARFTVDLTTGCLFTAVQPSTAYTKDEQYVVSVYAADASTSEDESQRINAEVIIYGDTYFPQFTQEVYTAQITEEQPGTHNLITVEALSFNIKLAVEYTLVFVPAAVLELVDVSINAVSGEITLTGSLDKETMSSFYVEVQATEITTNPLSSTVQVNVEVEDINDCTPTFGTNLFTIWDVDETTSESAGPIYTFTATDCDEGSNAALTYSLEGADAALFRINDDGQLFALGNLDYDQVDPTYTFVVTVSDAGMPPLNASATVLVSVIGVNDEFPVFIPASYIYYIEKDASDIEVGAVYAFDADSLQAEETVSYFIDDGSAGIFTMNIVTGVISLNSNTVSESNYVLTIRAQDTANHPTLLNITVRVIDINENYPQFLACDSYSATVPEDTADEISVIQVSATDGDSGINAELTYSMQPDDTPFEIDLRSGLITLVDPRQLDRETTPEYIITAIATDQGVGNLQGFCTFPIVISDVNDESPVFRRSAYEAFVASDAVPGTTILVVEAEDPDTNTSIAYSTNPSNVFRITQGGDIYNTVTLENVASPYQLDVTASDGVDDRTTSVLITIGTEPSPPPDWEQELYTESIPESTPVGDLVLQVKASSSSDPQVIYRLLKGTRPETNSLLNFDLTNCEDFTVGCISILNPLDYEITQQIELTIEAEGRSVNSERSLTTAVFNITDVNDQPPTFLLDYYDATVREDLAVGEVITAVTADDADITEPFKEITYSIEDNAGSDASFFSIDSITGEIKKAKEFDSQSSEYLINILAEDTDKSNGNLTAITTVRIYVLDVNNNKPVFNNTPSTVYITEDAYETNPVIQTLTATDADTDSILRYFLSSGTDGVFSVDAVTGEIVLASPLDYENVQVYNLEFTVSDGLFDSTVTFDVNVSNIYDTYPQFTEQTYDVTVVENTFPTDPIETVLLEDFIETPDSLTYSLPGGSSLFTIDADTGEVKQTAALDREAASEYNLLVMADAGGQYRSYAEISVTVDDVNEYPPYFPQGGYVGYVDEKTADEFVVTVEAVDPDLSPLSYQLSGEYSINFRIDNGGNIYTTTTDLDIDVVSEVRLNVIATDEELDESAETQVTVYINDMNDNQPVIESVIPSSPITIDESVSVGETVATVQAADGDPNLYSEVFFSITPNDTFAIYSDPYTLQGLIYPLVQPDCDPNEEKTVDLTVTVNDGVSEAFTTVQIVIKNVDEGPVINPQSCTIEENKVAYSQSCLLSASDPEGETITSWSIGTNPGGIFSVTGTGDFANLVVSFTDGVEYNARYYPLVQATDKGGNSGSETIEVFITDMNDEDPYFPENYVAYMDPDTPAGTDVIQFTAVDDDSVSGNSFQYSLGSSTNLFEIPNENAGILVTRSSLQAGATYEVTVDITDNANCVPSCTQNTGSGVITVIVYDINTNAHQSGEKTINVYSYEGNIPTAAIGSVPYLDDDNLNDKTFSADGTLPNFFTVDSDTGVITMQENTPAAEYIMNFIVSDGMFNDVSSTVKVIVTDVPHAAVLRSGSIRFGAVTPEDFISSYASTLDSFLTDLLNGDVEIFTVLSSRDDSTMTDVRFSVSSASVTRRRKRQNSVMSTVSEYQSPEDIAAVLQGSQDELESTLGLTVEEVPVDECIPNLCGGSCTNYLYVDSEGVLVDSSDASIVSVNAYAEAICSCSVSSDAIGGCQTSTCLNGGACVEDGYGSTGHKCYCPPGYDGPNCQQTKRTFSEGFAWFQKFKQCDDSHISLEVLTSDSTAILFFIGPITSSDPLQDFILLELESGFPALTVSIGGSQQTLNALGRVNDGNWHQIDIYILSTVVELVVDSCIYEDVFEDYSQSDYVTTDCKVQAALLSSGPFATNGPLQLGGVDASLTYPAAVATTSSFTGCIRNLDQDGEIYDLENPSRYSDSEAGCSLTDLNCLTSDGEVLCLNGVCDSDRNSGVCVCHAGWTGTRCNTSAEQFSFDSASYVTYQLSSSLNLDPRTSDYYFVMRTRATSGIMWTIANLNTYEHITLALVDGYLQASWHLGDAPFVDSLPYYPLNDGEWHSVSLQRTNNFLTIKVDGGGGVRELTNQESTFWELVVDPASLKLGAMVVRVVQVQDNFEGCLQDVRLDNNMIGIMEDSSAATISSTSGITMNCTSDVCLPDLCASPLICEDLWLDYTCICPGGFAYDTSGDICVPDCSTQPCLNGGTCVELGSDYECQCPTRYSGDNCEIFSDTVTRVRMSTGATLAIVFCLLILLILLILLVCWNRTMKEEYVKHMADPDDVRETLGAYDEEGGEADNEAFDINLLMKPVANGRVHASGMPVEEGQIPVEEERVVAQAMKADQSTMQSQPRVGDYLLERKDKEDNKSDITPFDTLLTYNYEGDGISQASLSSLSTNGSGLAAFDDFSNYLYDLGPPFRKLADMYGHDSGEEGDDVDGKYPGSEDDFGLFQDDEDRGQDRSGGSDEAGEYERHGGSLGGILQNKDHDERESQEDWHKHHDDRDTEHTGSQHDGYQGGSHRGSLDGSVRGAHMGDIPESEEGPQERPYKGSVGESQEGSVMGSQGGSQRGIHEGSHIGSQGRSQRGSQEGSQRGSHGDYGMGSQEGSHNGSLRGSQMGSQEGSQRGSQRGYHMESQRQPQMEFQEGSHAGSLNESDEESLRGPGYDEDPPQIVTDSHSVPHVQLVNGYAPLSTDGFSVGMSDSEV